MDGSEQQENIPIHTVYTSSSPNQAYRTKSIIIATGASPRWLHAENEDVLPLILSLFFF